MRRLIPVLSLAAIASLYLASVATAQLSPEFKLGFKELADLIPSVVGTPLENEHWGANGDSLQQTTTGLMAWRKADNWTAFTNGSRTWVNGGQYGVRERSNDERFPWEADDSSTGATAGQSYSDPFVYCVAVGTIDAPDGRYTGSEPPDAIIANMGSFFPDLPPEVAGRGLSWRCLKGRPIACEVGANIPCLAKMSFDRTPTQAMADFCQSMPDSLAIPTVVTGRETVFGWKCSGTIPVIEEQWVDVDSQGFGANFWYETVPQEYLPFAAEQRDLNVGDRFDVVLKSNPSTGFKWDLAFPTDEGPVKLVGTTFRATPADGGDPMIGAGGEEVWTFEVVRKGHAFLAFDYHRPWESVQPAQRYAVPINVYY